MIAIMAACLLAGVRGAKANDSEFLGYGVNVYPVRQPDIKMDYELLTIAVDENTDWSEKKIYVDVHFVFRNAGPEKTVTIGFTEWGGGDDEFNQDQLPTSHDFTTSVDGVPVEAVPQALVRRNDEYDFTRVHLWRVHFREGQSRTIHNTYWLNPSNNMGGDWSTGYILKTGGLWAGTIGRIDIIVRARVPAIDYVDRNGDGYGEPANWMTFVPFPEEYSEFHAMNWQPDHDIYIESNQFRDDMLFRGVFDNPRYEGASTEVITRAERAKAVRERQALIRSYIAGLSEERLSTCSKHELQEYINGIYATYGRAFQSPEWAKFFKAKWWYEPDPTFKDSTLTVQDQKAVARLQQYVAGALETQEKP